MAARVPGIPGSRVVLVGRESTKTKRGGGGKLYQGKKKREKDKEYEASRTCNAESLITAHHITRHTSQIKKSHHTLYHIRTRGCMLHVLNQKTKTTHNA